MPDAQQDHYYNNVRRDLIALISGRGLVVLEIGSAEGATLAALKQLGIAQHATGVDIRSLPGQGQHHRHIDELIIGDIEQVAPTLPEYRYDLIICGDILEHLIDPWSTLGHLSRCLKPDGSIIASIPNICYIGALKKIVINRDFRYEDQGIFDRTHLRFFCKRNIITLFKQAGFKIVAINSTVDGRNRSKWLFNTLTFGLFYEYLVKQFFVTAVLSRASDE
ncbi:MAG: class I SAM-dependent methyltransferase [Lamprocystis purpurea]|jgi:2-polyprenyl-3-methyl-5-hydroxy-6-metoxy-1,4-benzoquinol methylase|uniref:class I SAM-dependent methyltransferase n=1 Tax=Lamprocystis purpurea TaxID=61598 RepID=UPI0003606978|nr:class I SAM-dependent methyltransferase [Lamprocystis purpurea]MBV5272916.1 class I SAM-dependent methyltransferase [Lamprocystis purpurea]